MLNNTKHKEKKNAVVYVLTEVLAKGIPFLLLPFYTKYLTTEQFGSISIFNVIVDVCVIFILLGANSYYRVEYFKIKNRHQLISQLLSNVFVTFLCTLTIMCLFIYLGFTPETQTTKWLFVAVVTGMIQSVMLLMVAEFQSSGKAFAVGAVNISVAIVGAIITVALLLNGWAESSRYLGYFLSSIVAVVIAFVLYKKLYAFYPHPSLNFSKEGFRFGIGVLPHALSWWMRVGMDRIIIASFVSLAQTGLYSVAAQFSFILIVVFNAVNQAIVPKIMYMLTEGEQRKSFKFCLVTIVVYFFISLALFCFSLFIFDWFIDEKFSAAKDFLLLMCVIAFLHSAVVLLSNIFYFYKRVKLLSSITFITSITHVLLAFLLVKPYGVLGVIWSSIFTYCLSLLVMFFLSKYIITKNSDGLDVSS